MNSLDLIRLTRRRFGRGFVSWTAIGALSVNVCSAQSSSPASAKSNASEEPIVQVTPFEVTADKDGSYGAVNSNSITMFQTELAKTPISADVYTKAFIDDVGARTIEALILGNTAGAGVDSSNSTAVGNNQAGDRNTAPFLLRGLTSSVSLRNSFMPGGGLAVGMSSVFDVERVEVINGPQSLLYGLGGAGGVINTITKRAVFNRSLHGTAYASIDGFGNPGVQFDFGQGGKNLSYVASFDKERIGGYRKNVHADVAGGYVQFGWKFANTLVRLTGEYTDAARFFSFSGASGGMVYRGPTGDVRTGQLVSYLLASNQLTQAANGGLSNGGVIGNGHLTWKTLNSYEGNARYEKTINELVSLEVQTRLTSWLSMSLSLGYRLNLSDFRGLGLTFSLDAPGYQFNPFGKWAILEESSALDPNAFTLNRNRHARLAFSLENSFFKDRIKSSTVIGVESTRADTHAMTYYYYKTDANGNVLTNSRNAGTAADIDFGRTMMGGGTSGLTADNFQNNPITWNVDNGPVLHALVAPFSNVARYNGNTYVRQPGNLANPTLISPSNPYGYRIPVAQVGVAGQPGFQAAVTAGRSFTVSTSINKALFFANTLSLFHDKLQVLTGVRLQDTYRLTINNGLSFPQIIKLSNTSGSVGLSYGLMRNLHVYGNLSDSRTFPSILNDPYGFPIKYPQGLGKEVGIKLDTPDGKWSGTLAGYHTSSKNESFAFSSTLVPLINPTGLNGQANLGPGIPGANVNVEKVTKGVSVLLVGAPVKNLRLRFSGAINSGTIATTATYDQLYNDQFYQNPAGNVTYKDGTLVFVPAAPGRTPVAVTSTTAGAVPLTLNMLNDPSSPYYAFPKTVNSQIDTSKAGNLVSILNSPLNPNNPILTGVTGLPINKLQVAPNGVVPGSILVSAIGDVTVGYPKYNVSSTAIYSISEGRLRGARIGGTLTGLLERRGYYYYPAGVASVDPLNPNKGRTLFYYPNMTTFNLIAGYDWKIGSHRVSTQLNVNNMFNHYNVLVLPSLATGLTVTTGTAGLVGTLDGTPRTFVLTNRVSF